MGMKARPSIEALHDEFLTKEGGEGMGGKAC